MLPSLTTRSYDALGRLTSAGSTSYTSNGDGVLVQAGATTYTQDLAASLSQVLSDGSATYLYGRERLRAVNGPWYLGDGIDVRILLPATNDLPLVGAFSRYGYRPLLEAGVQIWEYAGLMMHAKTTVADGWWSRVGSTNLNPTGLLTNWEIDLVAEDLRFGATMEAMYEDDLAHARAIHLSGVRPRARPSRPESRAERAARRHRYDPRTQAGVAVARFGAAIQTAGSATLQRQERTITASTGVLLVSLALLAARFPRLVAWPLSGISALLGALSLARAARAPQPIKVRSSGHPRLRLRLRRPDLSTRRRLRRPRFSRRFTASGADGRGGEGSADAGGMRTEAQ